MVKYSVQKVIKITQCSLDDVANALVIVALIHGCIVASVLLAWGNNSIVERASIRGDITQCIMSKKYSSVLRCRISSGWIENSIRWDQDIRHIVFQTKRSMIWNLVNDFSRVWNGAGCRLILHSRRNFGIWSTEIIEFWCSGVSQVNYSISVDAFTRLAVVNPPGSIVRYRIAVKGDFRVILI